MRYIDANILVRCISNDHPQMSAASEALFQRLEQGEEQAMVLEATIAEVIYVLSSRRLYDLEREHIREVLFKLLSSTGLILATKERCLRALDLFAGNHRINFADALIVAAAEVDEPHEVYSFDRGFDSIAGITRIEP